MRHPSLCVSIVCLWLMFFLFFFLHAHTYVYIIEINHPHITCVLLVAGGLNTHRWLRSDVLLNQEHSRVSERRCDPAGIVGYNKYTC